MNNLEMVDENCEFFFKLYGFKSKHKLYDFAVMDFREQVTHLYNKLTKHVKLTKVASNKYFSVAHTLHPSLKYSTTRVL